MRGWTAGFAALLAVVTVAHSASSAQGGGASSTGTIQGRVTDAQGAVLTGVTVTATSPSAPGAQTTVTSETGNYRFPAVPPGAYAVTYELAGFNRLKREGIQITLGFTAKVNVELALATLQETVTVIGESPVIDTTTTRIQQNFKLDQLQSIPNGRDMWALLALTPSVQMARIDVGGNRAGTQTGYTAFGFNGQVRVLIEGINTTEGTGGAGFYFDYASLEEAFLGTSGQSAEMPNPGVQSQFIARSGSNQFLAEYHLDWYNNSLQGSNLPDEYIVPTAFNNSPIREHSNEISKYYDHDISAGGPITKDKIWFFGTYRVQQNGIAQPNFQFDKTFDTKLWNAVGKVSYQMNQKNKFIGYYQWGQKTQPNRLPFATYTYASPEQTWTQNSGSWVYKGESNGTVSDKMYLEGRYGDFGYYFPLFTNSPDQFFFHDSAALFSQGAHQKQQLDRDRKQYNVAATYFLDTGKGSHTFKSGIELLREKSWEGYSSRRGGESGPYQGIEHIYANGVSSQVIFGLPTATCKVGSLSAHDCLTSQSALDQWGMFLNDTWAIGWTTVNMGVRYDRYSGWNPEQEQIAAAIGRASVPAVTFPKTDLYTWNVFAPRIGAIYDLSGDGRTVIKANYGLYWHNPGVTISQNANPNIASKSATYSWNDRAVCAGCIPGDRRWQAGEEAAVATSSALGGTIKLNPDIKAPYTHEASVFFERQLNDTTGVRAGFVYKTEDDLITNNYQLGRGLDAYTVPFTFVDIGVDGLRGTADDKNLTLLGFPTANAAAFPVDQFVTNLDQFGRYKTIEVSTNKRYGNRWSATLGGGYTWQNNFIEGFPQNPNQPGAENRTSWGIKATGSYDAPHGIRISPIVRHQSGVNFARTYTITVPAGSGLAVSGTTAYADHPSDNREDNILVFDVRVEKQFGLGPRLKVRGYMDFFNLTNSHASETIGRATGTSYLKPTLILAPRTARLGFRVLF
jgi:Carboxypeptidase regulatory-like domain